MPIQGALTRSCLVTGGPGPLARAICSALAQQGHRVTLVGAGSGAADARSPTVQWETADVQSQAEVAALFGRLEAAGEGPAVLVNVAEEFLHHAPFAETRIEDIDRWMGSAARGVFLTCQRAAPAMVARRFGRIVNLMSTAALQGLSRQLAPATSAGAVWGLTRALARELAPSQVTVNAVSAGAWGDAALTANVSLVPLRRAGTAEEIASAVVMLCDERAGYLTGQCIAVDGGLT